MGIKDLFKKKKEEEPVDINLRNLYKGCVLDYFMQSWVVKECYEYDWGNNFFTKEYLIDSGQEQQYLHVEEDGELEITLSKEVSIMSIDKEIKSDIIKDDQPGKKIIYQNKTYYLSGENQGYFKNVEDEYWSEFVSWEFVDEEENEFIGIMRWGETDFSASVGQYVNEYEFSNFLPSTK